MYFLFCFVLFFVLFYIFGPPASRILCTSTWVGTASMWVKYKTTAPYDTVYLRLTVIFTRFINKCVCMKYHSFLFSPGFEKLNSDLFPFGIRIYAHKYTFVWILDVLMENVRRPSFDEWKTRRKIMRTRERIQNVFKWCPIGQVPKTYPTDDNWNFRCLRAKNTLTFKIYICRPFNYFGRKKALLPIKLCSTLQ